MRTLVVVVASLLACVAALGVLPTTSTASVHTADETLFEILNGSL